MLGGLTMCELSVDNEGQQSKQDDGDTNRRDNGTRWPKIGTGQKIDMWVQNEIMNGRKIDKLVQNEMMSGHKIEN